MEPGISPRTHKGSSLGETALWWLEGFIDELADGCKAKTQSPNDNSAKIATTAYVDTGLSDKAKTSDLDDYLPLSGGTMTGAIETNNDEDYVPVPKTAQAHNGIYRGKDFGTISSVAQLEAFLAAHDVSTGKFTDLYIGDYFLLQDGTYNKAWEIAGFDWYINKGDTALTTHHLALIPKENLTDAQMNASNTTTGAYYNSYMHQTVIPQVNTHLATVLGTHLLERKALLSNTMDASAKSNAYSGWSGCSSGWAWYAVKACLMSEVAVYGFGACGNMFDAGEDCVRLPIFNFKEHVTNNRQSFWLRAVAASTYFAFANFYGGASSTSASYSFGVRPLICVG